MPEADPDNPVESIEAYVERIVSTWPPLTSGQRRRLERLVTPEEVPHGRSAAQR